MNARPRAFALRLPLGLKWMALAWIVAEILVFAALVHVIGFVGTVLLGLATTLIGVAMLRRIGLEAMRSVRRTMEGTEPPGGALLDGMLSGFGALLLIVPGFLANAAGLALAAPSVRRKTMRMFDGTGGFAGPRVGRARTDVIDLGPDDWRRVDRR